MSLVRSALLAASQSRWLREKAARRGFVRRAVTRFMPGERLDDALAAAALLQDRGITSVVTFLGENVADEPEASAVSDHYLDVLERIRERRLTCEISVKLTHLGLDLSPAVAARLISRIAARARANGNRVWIDMESSAYTEATIAVYRGVHAEGPGTGLCLQAYLRRTRDDLESLLPLAPAIRLVKGAYKEPSQLAFPIKRDVDESFYALATRLLEARRAHAGTHVVFGTHDPRLIGRVIEHAETMGLPARSYEFDLLYGIRRDEQERLTRQGHSVRVLISYGDYWFPWYMRRLAERPANLWFVARSVVGR